MACCGAGTGTSHRHDGGTEKSMNARKCILCSPEPNLLKHVMQEKRTATHSVDVCRGDSKGTCHFVGA